MSVIRSFHSEIIQNVAEEQGFSDYKLEINSGSSEGNNYMSNLISVAITSGDRRLDLILKYADQDESYKTISFQRQLFLREIYIYENVLPEFKNFQKKNEISRPFNSYPKVFASSTMENEEFILMENLKLAGYDVLNMREPFNETQMIAVLEEYAKLHAISFALREKKLEKYLEIKNVILRNPYGQNIAELNLFEHFGLVIDMGLRAVGHNEIARAGLERIKSKYRDIFYNIDKIENHLVVCHGDTWCNNVLFKLENSHPHDIRLIDWQLSAFASPASDVSYFMFTCGTKEMISNYKLYLKKYYNTFSENLKEFGCDAEKLYPLSFLEKQWDEHSLFALIFALHMVRCSLKDKEEVGRDGVPYDCYLHNEEYANRILGIVLSMVENNLL